jgi:hypothetical protein
VLPPAADGLIEERDARCAGA